MKMRMKDEKVIEFLSKSPMKSLPAMLDTLRYLDGNWIWEDLEYELFDEPLGDNLEGKVRIRVPNIRGITANALLAFTWHALNFNLVRRRSRSFKPLRRPKIPLVPEDAPEVVVFYNLTAAGREMIKILEAVDRVRRGSRGKAPARGRRRKRPLH